MAWGPIEVLTTSETAAADQRAIALGTPGSVLMSRAGAAVAAAILARFPAGKAVVLCGPGSNGGDGFVVAERLKIAGWPVRVASGAASWRGDAALARRAWMDPVEPLDQTCLEGATLVVDALYGAGLSRPLAGIEAEILKETQRRKTPMVAVDLPSGLSGDLGYALGFAPQAALTVTFHRKKPAHVLYPGRGLCGEICVADIGLDAPDKPMLFENAPPLWEGAFPWPAPDAHKARRGHLMAVSGAPSQTGAARLACRAGLRSGAGLVTLLAPPASILVNAAHLEAVMLRAFASPEELAEVASASSAVIIGPAAGVGEATRAHVLALKASGRRLIVDADALTSFRSDPETLFAALDEGDILTPHAGEFERLFPGLLSAAPERVSAVREASRRSGAVVLLKGPDTAVADPEGRCAVNVNATPFLATAGSGDVLAGFIGGLAAQGVKAFEAACAGVYLHGAAGSSIGPGLTAEDLPGALPAILSRLYETRPML